MRRTATAVLLAALALTACGGPDIEACEQAMRDQFDAAMATGEEGSRPSACEGVSDEKVADIAMEIIGEAFEE
jgi:hypothetical protein